MGREHAYPLRVVRHAPPAAAHAAASQPDVVAHDSAVPPPMQATRESAPTARSATGLHHITLRCKRVSERPRRPRPCRLAN